MTILQSRLVDLGTDDRIRMVLEARVKSVTETSMTLALNDYTDWMVGKPFVGDNFSSLEVIRPASTFSTAAVLHKTDGSYVKIGLNTWVKEQTSPTKKHYVDTWSDVSIDHKEDIY